MSPSAGPTWESTEAFLIADAESDLRVHDEARPCFVAFAGSVALVLAHLRPFAQGEYHAPLIELLALASPLGANRMMLSITGRAWSLADPIPPVDRELGDLRQRVLTIEQVDGAARRVRSSSLVLPFDTDDGEVTWGDPVRMPSGEGWIPRTLAGAVRMRRRFRGASTTDIRDQVIRCAELGHLLALGPAVADRLGVRAC